MTRTHVTRKLLGAAGAAAFTAMAGSALVAGPAQAGVEDLSVIGLNPGTACAVSTGCAIHTTLTGTGKLDQVEFLVDGQVIGTSWPATVNGAVTASYPWWPEHDGAYSVGVRQGLSSVTIVYTVGKVGLCSVIPGSASSGSAGSGSASGSFGSGSAGSGSAGTGSGTGSGC
ncbi:hypothetical protein [Nocardia huaxiensis]|uniref:Ig-like domain-containing protein n=1 Tax=Nocardia huaxiensis TaxID=2755382 RepID=A0A7D6Z0H9_9NOCA|nr:hypothetical protein [Nocardia huaxiensis]QLY29446.1 hypothetical protein H0264_29935 [Nocardia huaxiensis]UFS97004.1 hypothetical protein LPY97_03455 [Nocardia huaxiensis]